MSQAGKSGTWYRRLREEQGVVPSKPIRINNPQGECLLVGKKQKNTRVSRYKGYFFQWEMGINYPQKGHLFMYNQNQRQLKAHFSFVNGNQ